MDSLASSAPQSHAFLAPFSLLRFQLIGIEVQQVADRSLAPDSHMFLSPASLRQRLLVVVIVEALTPQRHVLLPPPPFVATEIRGGAFAPRGDVVAAPRSLLQVEPRRR